MSRHEIHINGVRMSPIMWWGEYCVEYKPSRQCPYFVHGDDGTNLCMAFEEDVTNGRCPSCIQAVGK